MSNIVLSQLRWPSLAQDLAVMTLPGTPLTEIDGVRKKYGLSDADLKHIITIPYFQRLFNDELAKFQQQGSKAVGRYQTGILAQSLTQKLFNDVMDPTTKVEARDALKLLELLLKAGGLLDHPKDGGVTVNTNIAVQAAVQGALPKSLSDSSLKHAFTQEAIDVV